MTKGSTAWDDGLTTMGSATCDDGLMVKGSAACDWLMIKGSAVSDGVLDGMRMGVVCERVGCTPCERMMVCWAACERVNVGSCNGFILDSRACDLVYVRMGVVDALMCDWMGE